MICLVYQLGVLKSNLGLPSFAYNVGNFLNEHINWIDSLVDFYLIRKLVKFWIFEVISL